MASSHFSIGQYRNLTVTKHLAEGGFGVVELVVDNVTKNELVLKRCALQRPESFAIGRNYIKY